MMEGNTLGVVRKLTEMSHSAGQQGPRPIGLERARGKHFREVRLHDAPLADCHLDQSAAATIRVIETAAAQSVAPKGTGST